MLAGVGAGALLFATAAVDPANLYPSLSPHEWPQLALLPVLAVALAAAPARLTRRRPPRHPPSRFCCTLTTRRRRGAEADGAPSDA